MEKLFDRNSLTILFVFITVFLVVGCSKTGDLREKVGIDAAASPAFYTVSSSTDLTVAAIAASLQRQDVNGDIESKLSNHAGLPKWDKALVAAKEINNAKRGEDGIADSVKILLIPFVHKDANQTNAMLKVQVTAADTTYQLIYAGQYAEFGFEDNGTEWNAGNIFHLFTRFDNAIFGHRKFRVKDDRILGLNKTGDDEAEVVELLDDKSASKYILDTYCNSYNACLIKCPAVGFVSPRPSAARSMLSSVCCLMYGTKTECTTISVDIPSGGGGGSPVPAPLPGGGFGGVPGGGSPITYPCDGKLAGRYLIPNPGEPLFPCYKDIPWEPVPHTPLLPPAEAVDSMLVRYYKAIKPRTDSLLSKSLRLNSEHSMIIVKKGDSIYLRNEKTINDSLSTEVDFALSPGEVLLGYIHCHSSASLNPNDRSAPSGSDVKFLAEKLTLNFVQFSECGNTGYALVIEDISKAKNFLDSMSKYDLDQSIRDSALKVQGWFTNWQNATQVALIKLLKSASLHGIGFYKSTDPMRKTWIRLN